MKEEKNKRGPVKVDAINRPPILGTDLGAMSEYTKIETSAIDTPKKTYWKDLEGFLLPLDGPIDKKLVPYSDEPLLSPRRLWNFNREQLRRESGARLVYRGESRYTPSQILEAGGIHPKSVSVEVANEEWKHRGEWMLDVNTHRKDSDGSGMVSTTTSEAIGHSFADGASHPHLYILRAKNAIDSALHDVEHEFTVAGGFDKSDIIAFRGLSSKLIKTSDDSGYRYFDDSPLYINTDFVEKYPKLIPTLIHALLDEHEKITQAPPSIITLIATYPSEFNGQKLLENKSKSTEESVTDASLRSPTTTQQKLPHCHTFSKKRSPLPATPKPSMCAGKSENEITTLSL
ncbi:MAG: hypothetical protein QM752_02150 [Gammaproteobacteria bacterium]